MQDLSHLGDACHAYWLQKVWEPCTRACFCLRYIKYLKWCALKFPWEPSAERTTGKQLELRTTRRRFYILTVLSHQPKPIGKLHNSLFPYWKWSATHFWAPLWRTTREHLLWKQVTLLFESLDQMTFKGFFQPKLFYDSC